MANGTQTEETSLLDQIDAAREEIANAQQAEVDAHAEWEQLQEQVAEAQRKMDEAAALKREALGKMRALVELDDAEPAQPAAAPAAPARQAAPPARPAPARTGNVQPKAAVAPKPPARPAAKPAARPAARTPAPPARPAAPKPAPAAKPAPDGRMYGQETSLRKEIWGVLDRDPSTYKQYIADYPDDAVGLKVSELRTIIEKEAKWQSSSTNISPQIQQHLYAFRDAGKVDRDDTQKRYYIVEGATFEDAPAEQPAAQ